MVAFAEGILTISRRHQMAATFHTLWEAGAGAIAGSDDKPGALGAYTIAVVAAGTGLGNVALMHKPDMPFFEVVPTRAPVTLRSHRLTFLCALV